MKTQTETFRGYGKLFETNAQTAVECRFPEVETALSVHACPRLSGAEAGNGEVRYYGRVHFSIVYEDADRRVCRAEKGVEFTAVAKDERVFPAAAAQVKLSAENISVRREGASTYVTALLGADIALFGEQSFEYLAGGDLVLRREPVRVLTAHLVSGDAETEDDFEAGPVGDILQHAETVHVTGVACGTDGVRIEGEVLVGVLAAGGDSLVSFERLVPFRIEIPSEAAGCRAEVAVTVREAQLRADADEERGKCPLTVTLSLHADVCLYEETAIDGVTDAFSRDHAVTLACRTLSSSGVGERTRFTERVTGRAALSSPVDFSDTLEAVTLVRAEANLQPDADGARAEGVALATLLVRGADGSRRGIEMSLPFSVAVQARDATVEVLACGMSARQKEEGTIDAEVTLKCAVTERAVFAAKFVTSAEEGAPLAERDSAVSVYVPRAGDGLWELSKRLNKSPEEVTASNPGIEFPIKEGQRVIIYRKKTIS